MTQQFTARKVECGDVGKIVARREIEMIKKRGSSGYDATNREMWNVSDVGKRVARREIEMIKKSKVSTVVRSFVHGWKRGEGEYAAYSWT